mmetsp:Transcript_17462/g.37738  ORF Transcript_17462/g.37738 Transcript_17462/m.37738 type:complete len:223 (+) Transcript_17462:480-1148(+)
MGRPPQRSSISSWCAPEPSAPQTSQIFQVLLSSGPVAASSSTPVSWPRRCPTSVRGWRAAPWWCWALASQRLMWRLWRPQQAPPRVSSWCTGVCGGACPRRFSASSPSQACFSHVLATCCCPPPTRAPWPVYCASCSPPSPGLRSGPWSRPSQHSRGSGAWAWCRPGRSTSQGSLVWVHRWNLMASTMHCTGRCSHTSRPPSSAWAQSALTLMTAPACPPTH